MVHELITLLPAASRKSHATPAVRWDSMSHETSAPCHWKPLAAVQSCCSVLQRHDLTLGARLLYCGLRAQDDAVVCADPDAIAAFIGIRPTHVRHWLSELSRDGIITEQLGNLVFLS